MAELIVPSRFLDAGDEPEQILTPLEGYENVPVISLKEAVEPIKSLLYNADFMVEKTIRKCRKPADGLTVDESGAIYLYTMQWPKPHSSLSTLLNERLRSQDRNSLMSWFLFLKLFLTALDKLPSFKGTVWRGVRGNLSARYNKDHIWWGISSCTETIDMAEGFIGSDSTRTIFTSECLNGKVIHSHSYFQEKNEILLLPGSYFQVIAKWKAGKDLYMVHLQEKTPPYVTIILPMDRPLSSLQELTTPTEKTSCTVSTKPYEQIKVKNNRWKQHGITIVGGTTEGNHSNRLYYPDGIVVDENNTVYIVDYENHRIVAWTCESKEGEIIAGGNGEGNCDDQLCYPADIIVDKQNDSWIISDGGNRRVIRWFRQNKTNQQIPVSDVDCLGLAMDTNRFLYVCDYVKNEVRRWKEGDSNGTIVAGGNGHGRNRNQLSSPSHIFVDEHQSVYVSDSANHRVMKWKKNAKEGIVVAGGNGEGNSLRQLSFPRGLIVDDFGQIYIADHGNHRVVRWCEGDTNGSLVVGGNGQGNGSNQLSGPFSLSFDAESNLYVADFGNNRIQKYEADPT